MPLSDIKELSYEQNRLFFLTFLRMWILYVYGANTLYGVHLHFDIDSSAGCCTGSSLKNKT